MDEFKINAKRFRKDLKRAEKYFNTRSRFPKRVLEEAKKNTPRQTGYAKRNTELKKVSEGYEIIGDYPYSGVIDKGLYGKPPGSANGPKTQKGYSKQAPEGIVKPTLEKARELAFRFLRKLK